MKTKLTQEQKRIKIAEACGWKWEARIKGAIKIWNKPPLMVFHDDELPDYFNDLNAMHEAEKVLIDEQDLEYSEALETVVRCRFMSNNSEDMRRLRSATAKERAEAFGKTLGLW